MSYLLKIVNIAHDYDEDRAIFMSSQSRQREKQFWEKTQEKKCGESPEFWVIWDIKVIKYLFLEGPQKLVKILENKINLNGLDHYNVFLNEQFSNKYQASKEVLNSCWEMTQSVKYIQWKHEDVCSQHTCMNRTCT